MDFVRSYFGTNEPLTSWTLFFSLFDWFAVWPVKKWGKKCSTGQKFITSYKIHTLVMSCQSSRDFIILFGLLRIYELYSSIWFVAQNWKHCNDWFLSRSFIAKICQCLGILYGGKITALKGYLIQNIYDPLLFIVSLTFYCVFWNFAICIQGIPAFRDFKIRVPAILWFCFRHQFCEFPAISWFWKKNVKKKKIQNLFQKISDFYLFFYCIFCCFIKPFLSIQKSS